MVNVELIYINDESTTYHKHLNVVKGASVAEVIASATLYEQFPETRAYSVGIYSKLVTLETIVKEGDRVEVYRPLLAHPMERRRLRSNKK